MCIVDLTEDDGTPNWGLAKITAVKPQNPDEEFHLHWFGTYSKAKSLAKRAYAPAYIDSRDDLEIYKWKKTKTLEEMTMRVHRSELRFYPFSLTDKNEIPVKIVKELVTDINRHVPGADISLYPVSSYLSKWIKPGAK